MRIPCSGGTETGGFDSRVSLINIRASVYTHAAFTRRGPRGVHAQLYDESRHVGKFQRDHQLQALRQTKGVQAAYRNILSNLRGAVRYDFITGRGTEVTHEGDVTFQCGNVFPFRSDSTSIIVRLGVRRIREIRLS